MIPLKRLAAVPSTLAVLLMLGIGAVAHMEADEVGEKERLEETVRLVREVKEFAKTLGIEPTEALLRSTLAKPASSMFWLWVQKAGTIAVSGRMDMQIGLKFSLAKEQLPLESLYKTGDYSVYYRRGNQFGDPRSVTTADFAGESLLTKVMVTLHEDLHDPKNLDLPWEIEESLVTPLGALAALAFFEHKEDRAVARQARSAIKKDCAVSRDLDALVAEALEIFAAQPLAAARGSILERVSSYPAYSSVFTFQLAGQDSLTALEAKISHDLAYYRYFDRVVGLYDRLGDLRGLITDLKKASRPEMDEEAFAGYLRELERRYDERSVASNRPAGERLCP